jgi:polyisoprenoid-binding protein YceI
MVAEDSRMPLGALTAAALGVAGGAGDAASEAAGSGEGGGRAAEVRFDPERSEIRFTLGATLHTVHGRVRLEEGRVRYDPGSGDVSGRLVVDARSAETGNAMRDRQMHDEVLESGTHPFIVFTPQRVRERPGAGGELTLEGRLAIHGGEHPVSVPIDVARKGKSVTVEGRLEVPYVDWGMKDPSVFLLRVDDHLSVTVRLVGTHVRATDAGGSC